MTTGDSRVGVIILAGGRVPSRLVGLCAHRALLPVAGVPIVRRVLDAVRCAETVSATVTVLPAEAIAELADPSLTLVPSGDSLVGNMRRGSDALAGTGVTHHLFVTGDLPLLTAESLDSFVRDSLTTGAELTYPIITKEVCLARFPAGKRTWVHIRDGIFTGGNAFFTRAGLLDEKQALIEELYAARKAPLRLAGILGWDTVIRFVLGAADLPRLEKVAARILGATARAVITPYAELGFDVDKPEDLSEAERNLTHHASGITS